MDVKKVIRELVNLPITVYCGFYQLRITHSLRDETVKLLKEQQEEIEKLKTDRDKYFNAYLHEGRY